MVEKSFPKIQPPRAYAEKSNCPWPSILKGSATNPSHVRLEASSLQVAKATLNSSKVLGWGVGWESNP